MGTCDDGVVIDCSGLHNYWKAEFIDRVSKTAELLGDLEHWQHDTFIVRWRDRGLNADAFVNFALDPDGKIREVRMEPISTLTDFSFDFQDLRLTPVAAPVK